MLRAQPFKFEAGNEPLASFVDFHKGSHVSLFTSVIVLNARGYLDIAEAVRAVHRRNSCKVLCQQALAVTSATQLQGSGCRQHALLQRPQIEVAVASNVQKYEF